MAFFSRFVSCIAVLSTFLSLVALAQGPAPVISGPLNLSLNSWNRAVILPNGQTFLLHLRDKQPIITKIFDSTGTERAGADFVPKEFNVRALERSEFRGCFALGGEVLLFIEQEYFFKNALFRLRFDCNSGRMLAEDVVATGESMWVLHRPDVPGYAIVAYNGPSRRPHARYKTCSSLTRYGADGRAGNPMPFFFEQANEKGDAGFIDVLNAEMDRAGGVLITVGGIFHADENVVKKEYIQALLNARLRASDTSFTYSVTKIPGWMAPAYTLGTNFSSSNALYQYLVSITQNFEQRGLMQVGITRFEGLFLQLEGATLKPASSNFFANVGHMTRSDTADGTDTFRAFPLGMWTDGEGVSTVLAEEYQWRGLRENGVSYSVTQLRGLHFTQYDPTGAVLFDTVLPKNHVLEGIYSPVNVVMRSCARPLFRYTPDYDSYKQMASVAWCKAGPAVCAVYNDAPDNIGREDGPWHTDLKNPRFAEAVLCRFSPVSRQVEQRHLFGIPPPGETRACIIESAHFDAARKRVASLIVHNAAGKQTVRMAWASVQ